MKILLAAVNAKYIHSNPAVYSLKAYAEHFCGGRTGADAADKSSVDAADKSGGDVADKSSGGAPAGPGCRIEIAEFTINQDADGILCGIYRRKPEVLAFSCYIWNLEMIERLLENLPHVLPETELWLGGPEVTYDAAAFLESHPQVRGIMTGEGEETFAELVAWYTREEERKGLSAIDGIVYRDSRGKITANPPRRRMDMDELPFLYENLEHFDNRIIYYESSRGCPFSCSYCLSSIDRSVRFRSVEKVKQELSFFLEHKVPQVKFVDRTFNCRHSHAMEIWRFIRDNDNGVTNFHFEIAADLLNEEELALLNTLRPGLAQMEIGVQSTNPQTLAEIDRISDFEKLSGVVKKLQQGRNIHLHLDLIAGLPYEDYDSFVRSFNDVYSLHPEQLQLGFLKVLKGSKMYRKAPEYGLCYRQQPVYEVLYSRWISYEELLKLKMVEEMTEVYYNSGQFANTMRQLEREFAHPFAMYMELAEYYESTGAAGKKHTRMARFDILRDFIRTKTDDAVYEELLLLDLYLREKSKSRPQWAKEQGGSRPEVLAFYRREEETRALLPGYEGRSAKQMMNMTHLEQFHLTACGEPAADPHWILFDYQRRDPLTQEAAVYDVTAHVAERPQMASTD